MSDDRLERIEATQTRIVNDLGEMKGMMRSLGCGEHSKRIDALDETVHGNGHPGLKTEVAEHEKRIAAIEEARKSERAVSRVTFWHVIDKSIALAALAVALFALLKR